MEKIVELTMSRLFQLAEYVLSKCDHSGAQPTMGTAQKIAPTIRFSNEDKMTEGELFV